MGPAPKRLSYAYHYDDRLQGSIHCEILVFERGSWVALPIYRMESQTAGSKTVLSGFIESSNNRRFRVILSYTRGSSRPSHWMLDHDIVCGMHLDGRRHPLSEHAIRQGTFENPLDLAATSEASELAALHPHIPKEQDQPFCWQARSDKYPQLSTLPKCATSIDELSSIRLELSRCKLQKIKRGVSVFPSSVPRDMSTRADRQFEVLRKKHADLTHEIIVDDTPEDKMSKKEVVSDFEYTSDPFVEFKLFYKDGAALERLGIKPANTLPSRTRGGTRGSTAAPAVKSEVPSWMPEGPSTVAEQRAALSQMKKALPTPTAKAPASTPINPQVTPVKRTATPSAIRNARTVSFAPTAALREYAEPSTSGTARLDKLAIPDRRRAKPSASSSIPILSRRIACSEKVPAKRTRPQESTEGQNPDSERKRPRARPTYATKTATTSHTLPRDPESYSPSYLSNLKRKTIRPPSVLPYRRHPAAISGSEASVNTVPVQAPPTPPSMHSDSDNHALPDIDSDNESLPSISDLIRGHKATPRQSQVPSNIGASTSSAGRTDRPSVRDEVLPVRSRPLLLPTFTKHTSTSTNTDSDVASDTTRTQMGTLAKPAMSAPAQTTAISSHARQESGSSATAFEYARRSLSPSSTLIEKKPRIPPTPASVIAKAKKPLTLIDLTLESEEEEEKKVVPAALSTPTASANGATGIERNAKARQEARDFLESLGILDDANVEDLLQAGFKSKNTFAPRLKCCAEEDRNALLGDLRQSMGRIDFSILAGFLKLQGIEC